MSTLKLLKSRLINGVNVMLGRVEPVYFAREKDSECPVCGKKGVFFKPLPFSFFREYYKHQYIHSIFQSETINLEFYTCSNCQANDRDRLYALYFRKVLQNSNAVLSVLDIAPASGLSRFLKSQPKLKVRTADLFMPGVDDKVDITNMTIYSEGQFDAFICSHVLEHIDEDVKAMKELYRILKQGGWGIAMVPINLALKEIYENPTVKEVGDRWKHFGQDDHVRMYSKQGFVDRLKSAGFKVDQLDISYFGEDSFRKHGIHPRSVLYIANK